jgi:RNA polymerase sigma factor (sigma-70 family)
MSTTSDIFDSAARSQAEFPRTHWSVVLSASDPGGSGAAEALEKLCRIYWYPLYAYVRRRGKPPPDAQDLTQEFFARLLARHWLERADQTRGRFRTFLLTALERFLANEWDKEQALKRGGAHQFVPLDFADAETRYGSEPAGPLTPEQVFERRWALILLDTVLDKLGLEYCAEGKADLFAALKPGLVSNPSSLAYPQLARTLDLSESGVRVAVHRLRQRYRDLLRAEIANTVVSAEEVEAEMRHLFNVLARR